MKRSGAKDRPPPKPRAKSRSSIGSLTSMSFRALLMSRVARRYRLPPIQSPRHNVPRPPRLVMPTRLGLEFPAGSSNLRRSDPDQRCVDQTLLNGSESAAEPTMTAISMESRIRSDRLRGADQAEFRENRARSSKVWSTISRPNAIGSATVKCRGFAEAGKFDTGSLHLFEDADGMLVELAAIMRQSKDRGRARTVATRYHLQAARWRG